MATTAIGDDGHAGPRRVMTAERQRRACRHVGERVGKSIGATTVGARQLVLDNVTYRRWRRRGRVLERVLDVQATRQVARWCTCHMGTSGRF